MESLDRILPNSLDAEQAVLGGIINNSDKLIDIEFLAEGDFYVSKHKKLYGIMRTLFNRRIAIDLITVLEEIRKRNALDECGGVTYVTELATSYIKSANVSTYADIVKEKSNRRRLIKASRELLESAYDDEIKNTIDKAESELCNIAINQSTSDIVTIDKAVEQAIISIESRFNNGGSLLGTSTGFRDLDKITSGLIKKDLVIIAGRPSMGKTAFALNLGLAASKEVSTAIFSLEMSKEQLTDRLLAAKCLVDFNKVRTGQLSDKEFEKIAIDANELMTRKLFLDDTTTLLNDIKAKCRKLKMV